MKFEIEDEVLAPQNYTFSQMTDFIRYEATALRYGADIRRVNTFHSISEGVKWRGTVPVYGKTRGIEATVTVYDRPHRARIETVVGGMQVNVTMMFEEIGSERTLLKVDADLKPTTLASRLILQSVKLGRRKIHAKIEGRVVALANEVETEFKRQSGG